MIYFTKNIRPATDSRFMMFGQRNSGTNYMESLMIENFNMQSSVPIVWKHWVGFVGEGQSKKGLENTLAISVARDPYDWLSSMKHQSPHAYHISELDWPDFLKSEWYSIHDFKENGKEEFNYEIMEDRDYETGRRYENILKMRSKKLKWLLDPDISCPYIVVRYEDLKKDFRLVINTICNTFSINPKHRPLKNVTKDAKRGGQWSPRDYERPPQECLPLIRNGLDWSLENKLGYKSL